MPAVPDRRTKRVPIEALVLLFLTLGFCADFLRTDRMLLLPDLFSLEMPGYLMYREHLLSGTLPLWTPYSGCGEPYLAGSDIGVFYPLNLLFLVLALPRAVAVFAALHLFLSAIATYWLCRLWRVSPKGSLLAAASFGFCSWSISRVEFLPTLASGSWFPINLAVFTLWLGRPRWGYAILLGGTLAMSLIAGWPEGTYFIAGSLVIYAAVAGIQRLGSIKDWKQGLLPLGVVLLAGVIGILLSAVQILPTWEAVSLSQRSEGVQPGFKTASVDPFMLFGLAIPSIYGLPTARFREQYWAPSCVEFYHGTFYVGVLPLVILAAAAVGFARFRRQTSERAQPSIRVPFLILLAVFSLLYAMGDYTPLFPWLRNVLPIVDKFHGPAKSLMCFVLALSCLAGIGLDSLVSCTSDADPTVGENPNKGIGIVLVVLTLLGLCLFGLLATGDGELLKTWYLRLGSIEHPAEKIPWPFLGYDAAKFAVLLVLSAGVVYGLRVSEVWRGPLIWAAVGLLVVDLWLANRPLLVTAETEAVQLERGSAFLDEVRPPGSSFRFQRPIRGHELYGETDPRLYNRARATLRGWWSSVDRAYNLSQCGPFRPRAVTDVLDLLDDPLVSEQRKARLLAMLNCERVVSPYEEPLFVTGRLNRLDVLHLPASLPRAYVVGGVKILADEDAVINELGFGEFEPLEVALVSKEQTPTDFPAASSQRGTVPHDIVSLQDGLNRLDLVVQSERAGVLVISDTYYPGWTATVNGEPAPIMRVNGGFRGIPIRSGKSEVIMRYQPATLRTGAIITLSTLAVIVAVGVIGFLRSRRANRAT